jgi:hypothetical protein
MKFGAQSEPNYEVICKAALLFHESGHRRRSTSVKQDKTSHQEDEYGTFPPLNKVPGT